MNRIYTVALLLAATMFPLASSLSAEEPMDATVPFAFSVAHRMLPPGAYRIHSDGAFLRIENRDDHRIVTLVANPGTPSENGKSFLSFDQVNGVFFLRRVITSRAKSSVELPASWTKRTPETQAIGVLPLGR